jgi:hypothetical protein
MYLTAQRVQAPRTHKVGVNVYRYVHGRDWRGAAPEDVLPDVDPGELHLEHVEIAPPGNRILSFLDVVLPDAQDPASVRDFLLSLKWAVPTETLPVVRRLGSAWVRFHMAPMGIASTTELAALAGHLVIRFYALPLTMSGTR